MANDTLAGEVATAPTLEGDLISGNAEIAKFLGVSPRRAYHLVATRQLPGVFKLGGRFCARKSTLLAEIKRLEQGAA